jgi:hypothetical protein
VAETTYVFHITHVDNLASMAESGLHCDAGMTEHDVTFRGIAYTGLKAQRAATPVLCEPGGTLADYVPFYFAPRSPMLYTIHRGNVAGAEGEQSRIVHLVLDSADLFDAYDCVFTDGHAIMDISNFYNDPADLDHVPWNVMKERYWSQDGTGEMRRKRQAEFLVHGHVPWDRVLAIAVMDEECRALVHEALVGVAHQPQVVVRRDWYY